ncbi:MAG: hypothetical protein LBF86_05235 [Helicobacteraceae bacterium]|jgi:tRNA U34 5-methylaminomethyl-2-thiouridine-forming methyltransferase MnmC|nr:hypothetical protein [Helicobacteraceae bacterium]
MRLVQSADNSFTLFSERYGEHYHSVGEGALRETLEKHIRPAFAFAAIGEKIRVLDICFGLGYNSLCAIANHSGKIEIIAPEIDRELIVYLPNLPYPKELEGYRPIIDRVSKELRYKDDRVLLQVVLGDAAKLVQEQTDEFDVIFQDPFSIRANAELWSESFFADLFRLLKPSGVLTTYSASHIVRERMKKAGFLLYAHPFAADSGLRKGTIASKRALRLEPLA